MHELTKGESMFTTQYLLIDFLEHVLLFDNYYIISKICSFFYGPDDSCIGGWLLGIVSDMDFGACICWMIDSKVFCNCFSFS
jgi:hypothetical protein